MNKTRLAPLSALTLALVSIPSLQAATYQVIELPTDELSRNSYSETMNNSGEFLATLEFKYNPPINVDLLNLESQTLIDGLTDIDAVADGNINAEDLAFLYSLLQNNAGNYLFQQIGTYTSAKGNENAVNLISGFDIQIPELAELSNSVTTYAFGINDNGWVVGAGSAPYQTLSYFNENDVELKLQIRDFSLRAYVDINGNTVPLLPPEESLGGRSEARDINDNNEVVGAATIAISEATQEAIDNCEDDETRGDVPLEYCLQNITSSASFETRAAYWKLNAEGQVIETKTFDMLAEPDDDSTRFYTSRAKAINNEGIIVGSSDDIYQGPDMSVSGYGRFVKGSSIITFATIFNDEGPIGFTNHDDYFTSEAVGINDNNLVIGQASKQINGYVRQKFFVHDIDNNETIYPKDFFSGSSSVAKGINNNDLVVGDGEVDSGLGINRRRHGFIYDYNEQSFTDLNDTIACDSPYTIVQANDINDFNEIIGTALIKKDLLNIAGEPLLNQDGSQAQSEVVVSVKLVPIAGGSIESCQVDDEDKYQRKAGSTGIWLILFAGLSMLLRRKI
ncbi:DUF3466 family protein [Neptunicella sp. SCSIO 80796]|uniref:DUF3466 family protein n=1 Tax=Neptunicella plasticusilytica TaxID=3117012 RepID=UPI003A4DE221